MKKNTKGAIHQFHANVEYGDAITTYMITVQRILRELGYESNIYSIMPIKGFFHPVEDWHRGRFAQADTLIIHHSSYNPVLDQLLSLPCRRFSIFHNITPIRFFDIPALANLVRLGYEQISVLGKSIEGWLCYSRTNISVLENHGQRQIAPISMFIPLAEKKQSTEAVNKPDKKTALFVGRVVPNKKQDELILTMRHYVDNFGSDDIQLILIGHDKAYAHFSNYCRALIKTLGLTHVVRLLGAVTEKELEYWYRACDVFLCLSEHEGFGLPLIEAMGYEKPILAYGEEGVVETVQDAGFILSDKDPDTFILTLRELLYGRYDVESLKKAQRRRVQEFSYEQCKSLFHKTLIQGHGHAH